MSIKNQKIIRFIPCVNFLVISIQWLKMYHKQNLPKKRMFSKLAIIFALFVAIMIPEFVLDSIFDIQWLEYIINFVVSCLCMYIFSTVAIYDQEQFMKETMDVIN